MIFSQKKLKECFKSNYVKSPSLELFSIYIFLQVKYIMSASFKTFWVNAKLHYNNASCPYIVHA